MIVKKKIIIFSDFGDYYSKKALSIILKNNKFFDIKALILSKKNKKRDFKFNKKLNSFYDGYPHKNKKILNFIKKNKIEFAISTGFPNRIRMSLIKILNNRIYNFHPAVLPYNKGSHSTFHAIINKTNYGATMHLMNKDFDSGEILDQIEYKNDGFVDANFIYKKSREAGLKLLKRNILNMFNDNFSPKINKKNKINFKKDIINHITLEAKKKYFGEDIWNLIRAVHFGGNGFFYKSKNKVIKIIPKIIKSN